MENLVVGAPCGVMDQMSAACGKTDRLLALLCQRAQVKGFVPIPDGIKIAGLDSGVRHAVTGAAYGDVHAGAFMGYCMMTDIAKLRVGEAEADGSLKIEDPSWRGYLANSSYTQSLPAEMRARISYRAIRARPML